MSIATLQDQINTKADARLRRRIDERLDPLRQDVADIGVITFNAVDPLQSAQPVSVQLDAVALVNVLADAAFSQRRDQARNKLTRDFLAKVADAGIAI